MTVINEGRKYRESKESIIMTKCQEAKKNRYWLGYQVLNNVILLLKCRKHESSNFKN